MDRRVLRTKRMLKDALLELLKDSEIEEITISELCRKADVNRNTFYAHYSVPADLLREIEDDLVSSILKQVAPDIQQGDYELLLTNVFTSLANSAPMSKVMQYSIRSGDLMRKFINQVKPQVIAIWENQFSLSQEDINIVYEYTTGGTVTLLKEWIEGNFQETPEEMAEKAAKLNQLVIGSFY